MRIRKVYLLIIILLAACGGHEPTYTITEADTTGQPGVATANSLAPTDGTPGQNHIETGKLMPAQLVSYAQTLKGVPYKYASTDPAQGFDCSGFITYVFNHFGIAVPRTSKDFTDIDHEVPLDQASPGDLVLFTGTDPSDRTVGHMGIIISQQGEQPVTFIHSTSGKAKGVVETPMNSDYMQRFVKVVRVF